MTDATFKLKLIHADQVYAMAGLRAIADGTDAGMIPAPETIHLYRHDLSIHELLSWADRYDVPVVVQTTAAAVTIPIFDRDEHRIHAEMVLFCNDLSDDAKRVYERHNTECIDPCANGRCPDREAHAEGAHDR